MHERRNDNTSATRGLAEADNMGALVPLFCQRMSDRLATGKPVREVSTPIDIEPTTGTMIVHGLLRSATLRQQAVTEAEWSGYALFGLHFIECAFVGCDLRSADMRGASFVGCSFADCRFDDSDMAGSYVHGSSFIRCNFTGARLTGAEFSRSKIVESIGWPSCPDSYRNEEP